MRRQLITTCPAAGTREGYLKHKIDFDSFMVFCKGYVGQTLPTVGGRAEFTLESVDEKGLTFRPRSEKLRRHEIKYLQDVLHRHAQTASLRPIDYNDVTRNASYILALVKLYPQKSSP